MLEFLFKKWPTAQKIAHRAFSSVIFPLTMVGVCAFIYFTGSDAGLFWTIVSIATAFPVFFNGIALFLLRDKVWALLKDYKARFWDWVRLTRISIRLQRKILSSWRKSRKIYGKRYRICT